MARSPLATSLNRPTNKSLRSIVIALSVLLTASLWSCSPKRVATSSFRSLDVDSGWHRSMPLVFTPQYGDSALRYDVTLAVRHTNAYPYANLSLVVDMMGGDSASKNRRSVNFTLADDAGNWKGAGFGALYQVQTLLAHNVTPETVSRVVVWQAMANVETLGQITDVGIIVTPIE